MGIADYSATAASNTTINGVNIDEGCNPGGINNAIREIMADIAAYDFPSELQDLEDAIVLKAAKASPTFTGTVTAPTLRLTATTDVSLTSTGHALQIGASSGTHLKMDGNELQAQSDASTPNTFLLNAGGGNVSLAASGFAAVVNGSLDVREDFTLNQTWQDVSASRVVGTSYRNTTGKPIHVNIVGVSASGAREVQVSSNNSSWITVGRVTGLDGVTVSFPVPDDWYYRFASGGGIVAWAELR